ncbi:multidrug resistance protein SMR [Brochothrix thermosphacta]|uniref:DMT family transporter n=1 Tax=Brochothrix thermosphacta TaxID=2756 RepID=UPI00083FB8E8|nr:SMR family transporter [Brochothrix thermosphacta]ODJ53208.1 multidrug resistance protein SMR [Brochothrix thermosphacta]
MSKSTLLIVLASLAEVGWVIGLKHSTNVLEWGLTVVCIAVSFGLLIKVSETNAVITSYALFVELGTLGTVLSSVFFFGEPMTVLKAGLLVILMTGVVGLKLTSTEK